MKIKTALTVLLVVFSTQAVSNQSGTYLYTMFHDDDSIGERFRTQVKDMTECLEILKVSRIGNPDKVGGDYEVIGAMWCGGEMERNYNSTWFKDEKRDLEGESK